MSRHRSESGGPAASPSDPRQRALTYDDLPPEMKDAIQDYLRFTNESLRAAVAEYFEDKAAAERRYGTIGTWEVGRVTDMSRLFQKRRDFNDDIGAWDTSSVTDMSFMFAHCYYFRGASIGAWNTSSVTNMSHIFFECGKFTGDIGRWNTSSVTVLSSAFRNCMTFNTSIAAWDTSSVQKFDATEPEKGKKAKRR
mmetsp:Transcript_20365/g.60733  ORF Transcript_20365/g.60733 Transcript_20365/m.60733 type:complete len:195 (-) Transcript_20365:84-668(-)